MCAERLISAKSYERDASNEPRRDGFGAVCGTGGTPTFWSWPGIGEFCRSGHAHRGPVEAFGALLQVHINYLLLSSLNFPTGECISPFHLSGDCRSFASYTFRFCSKLFDSAGFFILLSNVGRTTGSAFRFFGFRSCQTYDRLFLTCSAVLVIQPIAPASVFLVARLRYSTYWVVSSRVQHLVLSNSCDLVCVFLLLFSAIFFHDFFQSTYPFFVFPS